jgi:hypothetical protein
MLSSPQQVNIIPIENEIDFSLPDTFCSKDLVFNSIISSSDDFADDSLIINLMNISIHDDINSVNGNPDLLVLSGHYMHIYYDFNIN